MDSFILSIGSELTGGQSLDTNAAWLAAELTRLGTRVVKHVTVADEIESIRAVVQEALDESDLVITTGGLGPTPDDLTRQALALAINEPLEENAEALAQIRAFFERGQRPMHDANRVQAMFPRGCAVLANQRGTAPGIQHSTGRAELFALPGVPAEMKAMFQQHVAPIVAARTGGARTVTAQLRCFGTSEAKIGEALLEMMRPGRNPQVGTAAAHGIINVRISALGRDEDEAVRLLHADKAEARRLLGRAVFGQGQDTLESAVAELLRGQRLTIATAESCTGGLLAKRLTDIPGSSAYFLRGYVTYANQAKSALLDVSADLLASHGAVSEPVARAMASGCRTKARSDYALAVTGIAGPGGACPPDKPIGLAYLAIADHRGVEVKRVLLGEPLSRDELRDRASSAALNQLRLRLASVDTR